MLEFLIAYRQLAWWFLCYFFCMYMFRLLAREGINAEQLARDLKSFELKVPLNINLAIFITLNTFAFSRLVLFYWFLFTCYLYILRTTYPLSLFFSSHTLSCIYLLVFLIYLFGSKSNMVGSSCQNTFLVAFAVLA
jgi:hypothetical protein